VTVPESKDNDDAPSTDKKRKAPAKGRGKPGKKKGSSSESEDEDDEEVELDDEDSDEPKAKGVSSVLYFDAMSGRVELHLCWKMTTMLCPDSDVCSELLSCFTNLTPQCLN